MASTAIVWLRRDLRVHDHPALYGAAREHERVVPVFVLDERLTEGRVRSAARNAFLGGCLAELDGALAERGGGLVVRTGRPEDVIPALARETGASEVRWASDVSPFARARDRRVTAALERDGAAARPQPGSFCADVSRPRTKAGRPLTVFTPFHCAQRALERRPVLPAPRRIVLPPGLDRGTLPAGPALADVLPEPFAEPGEAAARAAMDAWLEGPVDRYHESRDDLAGATSGLSAHLRWGTLSARELEQRTLDRGGPGADAFARQLAWRDFHAHVLLFHPESTTTELHERWRALAWHEDPGALAAWQQGRTGYPLVDAGMRQLAATGWMHNRARMVTGSFLTKDLHLDWRHGRAWFDRLLLDADPAQNTGNWQWIASTGADPAPYFRRIFNPTIQQQRHDPTGTYVRHWVPELRQVPAHRLAQPWTMTKPEQDAASCQIGHDYPAPIVDHAEERRVALERYRAASA